MTPRVLARLVAAALVVAAAGLAVPGAAPAQAAMCGSSTGVNVVVDFTGNPDGGGATTSCDADGGGKAASHVFSHAGYALTYASREPGFVCRVSGAPQSAGCVNASPADAYWGLFWSDGTDGRWHYSSSGVGSTSVPAGGSLAFVWQDGGTQDNPPVAAPRRQSSPSPTPTTQSSSPQAGGGGTGGGTAGGTQPGTSPKPSAIPTTPAIEPGPDGQTAPPVSASASASAAASAKPSPTAPSSSSTAVDPDGPTGTASRTDAAEPSGDLPDVATLEDQEAEGLPLWVIGVVLLALAGLTGAVVLIRRRSP